MVEEFQQPGGWVVWRWDGTILHQVRNPKKVTYWREAFARMPESELRARAERLRRQRQVSTWKGAVSKLIYILWPDVKAYEARSGTVYFATPCGQVRVSDHPASKRVPDLDLVWPMSVREAEEKLLQLRPGESHVQHAE